jgi:hypothetical protein
VRPSLATTVTQQTPDDSWSAGRVRAKPERTPTQLHYARRGEITQRSRLRHQSGRHLRPVGTARSRITTIFMTTYFIGGALGTPIGADAFTRYGWSGACTTAAAFALLA